MARQQQNTRVIANKNQGAIEQQTIVDDSLLPSSEELARLKEIDPNIITWILQRTEKEQDARLNFNSEKIKLAHRDMNITISSLWLAFALAVLILALSGLFMYLGKEITGTVFGGVGILVIIQSLS
jgi:uncharacterized membrane protein